MNVKNKDLTTLFCTFAVHLFLTEMHIVDTCGLTCPAPLIATKRALKDENTGEVFQVITDSSTSFGNVSRFLSDNNVAFTWEESEGKWVLTVSKSGPVITTGNAAGYCTTGIPHMNKGEFLIAFTSDRMGEGDEDLGRLLIGNFIKSIKDLDVLPSKIVFYNKGVTLGSSDSPFAGELNLLEQMGVTLLFCATCVDHYSLGDKIVTGKKSNMFEIAQAMASASNVVKP